MINQIPALRDYPDPTRIDINAPHISDIVATPNGLIPTLNDYSSAVFQPMLLQALSNIINVSTNTVNSQLSNGLQIGNKQFDSPKWKYLLKRLKLAKLEEDQGEIKVTLNKLVESPEIRAQKGKEVSDFLLKKQEEKAKRKQMLDDIKLKTKLKENKIQEALQKEYEEKKARESEEKRKRIHENLKAIEKKAEERKKLLGENRSDYITPMNYLYHRLEKKQMELEEQEKLDKYQVMKQSHSPYIQPLDGIELMKHAKLVDYISQKHEKNTEEKIRKEKMDIAMRRKKLISLQSRASQKVFTQIELEKNKTKELDKNRYQMQLKMKAYSYLVKETKTPSISYSKLRKRLTQIDHLHTKKREGKSINELPDYLHSIKIEVNRSSSDHRQTSENTSFMLPNVQVYDYLKNQRIKREMSRDYKRKYNWEAMVNEEDLNSLQKCNKIITRAQQIETMAKREEKLMRLKNQSDITKEARITDLYLDSIKAKLAILDGL